MNKKLKQIIKDYKKIMIHILKTKYGFTTYSAWKWIMKYDFDSLLKSCDYIALHDDHEIWVDAIYEWKCSLETKTKGELTIEEITKSHTTTL